MTVVLESTPYPGTTDALWQNLTDALNALVEAGQFPDFHDVYGPYNDWQHQPYASAVSHAEAPWVVSELSARH
ncbi:hypothetical protein JK361_35765 [Streptomyces sp. 5-8]|uniref:Beta-ketoacyl synthase N-terminal domain-containing protein n=1 Tax=Streptomyces musisoli TaxID=2802280 RepID=A0ABS1PCJ1_9ACTN|nr:hypothetical protein [Streptomyces musisoli]MBL1109869.1 hypothetical protein [Streptomyces musisoli]